MSCSSIDLRNTAGYLVADQSGHLVGKVERPIVERTRPALDGLLVQRRPLSRHRVFVPLEAIAEIDAASGVVGLRIDRRAIDPSPV